MMRIRTVKPEWLEDERMSESSSDARALSICLILLADDCGRGRINRATIARCFPAAAQQVFDRAFEELSGWFVRRYDVRGQGYFEILNWARHQRIDKPSKPRTPEPPSRDPREPLASNSGDTREDSRDPREESADSSKISSVSYISRDPRETPARVPGGTGTGNRNRSVERARAPACVAEDVPDLTRPAAFWRRLEVEYLQATGDTWPGMMGPMQRGDVEGAIVKLGTHDAIEAEILAFVEAEALLADRNGSAWRRFCSRVGSWASSATAAPAGFRMKVDPRFFGEGDDA